MGRTRTSGQGRKKGVPNRNTLSAVEKVDAAWAKLDEESENGSFLLDLAHEDKRAFAAILARRLPKEIKADLNHRGTLSINAVVQYVTGKSDG